MRVGGLEDEKPADEHIDGIMKQAMDKLKARYPGGFKSMEPISYRTQVVAGMNYFVKVSQAPTKPNPDTLHSPLA